MIIRDYVKQIEEILEGKNMSFLDLGRINRLMDLLKSIKKKDDVRNVCDMVMFKFQSDMLAGRLNDDAVQCNKYMDFMSAFAEIINLYWTKSSK